jgi:hypothetical protein
MKERHGNRDPIVRSAVRARRRIYPHTGQVNNALLSPKATSEQTFRAARTCETLRRSIVSLQANLKTLDDICGLIGDPSTRETRHIKWN